MANEQPYTLTGLVECVGELQTFSKGFTKRELVVVDDPEQEYPNYAAFEFHKDKTQLLASLKKGERVTVKFFPEARSWKDPKTNKVKWFSSNRAVGLAIDGVNAQELTEAPMPEPATPPPEAAADAAADADDLPF